MTKWAWAVIIGVFVLIVLAIGAAGLFIPFRTGFYPGGMIGPRMMVGYGFPFLLFRGLGMLLFWGLIILAAFLLFRALAHSPRVYNAGVGNVPAVESPLEILKRRYAAGEITQEQYNEMRKTLDV